MDKHDVNNTYNETLFSLKKEGNSGTNMTEALRYQCKWNNPVTEEKYCMILPVWGSQEVRIIETESKMVIIRCYWDGVIV
jgi:hypothetical protein